MRITPLLTNEKFDELVNDIYDAVRTGDWQKSLKKINIATQSNKGFFNIVDIEKNQLLEASFDFQFDYDPKVLMYYLDNPHEDPFFHAIKHLPQGSVYDFKDYIDINEYSDSEFYQIVLNPMKSHHVLGSTLIRDGKYDSTFAINRGPNDPKYTEVEVQFIEKISTHFQRAVKLFNALQSERTNCLLNEAFLSKVNQPILMLDRDCRVVLVSHQTQSLILESPLLSLHKDGLHLNDEKVSSIFKKHIYECCTKRNTHDDYSVILEETQTNQVMRISISPLPSSLSLNNLEVDAAMVIIHSNQLLNIQSLEKEYSLTRKETEVLKMFFELRSIEEVAEYLGCAKFTVRNHLQALYKKLRINSQVELMSTLRLFLN